MNKIQLIGRLTKDPQIRYSQQNNTCIASFDIAVNKKYRKNDENAPTADFFRCRVFGKSAEFVEKYAHKGTKVAISGRSENDNYTNKDGQTVYSQVVTVEEIELCESKGNGQDGVQAQGQPQSQPTADVPGEAQNDDYYMNIPDGIDEELPFN